MNDAALLPCLLPGISLSSIENPIQKTKVPTNLGNLVPITTLPFSTDYYTMPFCSAQEK